MIKKITSIQNLGTFLNYSWNNQICSEFKRYNFFYGWNYSGKTTLSRLFRCLELRQNHPDFQDLEFDIKTEAGNITQREIQNHNLSIRVFNEEFVEENFKWNDENHRIQPVLILGKESIELDEKLKSKEKEKQERENERTKIYDENKKLENDLNHRLTNKASEIRKLLSITNQREFDKTALENKINELNNDYKQRIFTEDNLNAKLNTYRNQKIYEPISEFTIDFKLQSLIEKTNQLLAKPISAQQIIQKLKDNPALNTWVRQGIDLHQNEVECQFCGNKLPNDLFDRLNQHFSKEFDQLINAIQGLETEINNYQGYLEKITLTDKARFYEEFQQTYELKSNELKNRIVEIFKFIETLKSRLNEKKIKPFNVLENINIADPENEARESLNQLNKIIQQNNDKINGLSKEKEQIKKELLAHYSASAIDEMEYGKQKEEIAEKQAAIENRNKEIQNLEYEINTIKRQMIQANVGAEKVNKYLKDFFGDDQLQLKPLDEGNYQIYRCDIPAKNLSTGEKNMITLVYFISKLEETHFNLSDAIVFIDDPVSSLDSNHTFRVYGFLGEKVINCKQLLITTHNFDFYNLLKDLVKSDAEGTPIRQSKKEKENFYLVKKIQNDNQKCSIIENLPDVLKKFRSEYNYLFSVLKAFNDSTDKSNFDLLYLLPNIARRFLEAYLFHRYPDGKKFKEKCNSFFINVDSSKKQTVLKLLDEYSHEEDIEHAHKFPEINEIENCVKIILELLENKDKEHYDALIESLK